MPVLREKGEVPARPAGSDHLYHNPIRHPNDLSPTPRGYSRKSRNAERFRRRAEWGIMSAPDSYPQPETRWLDAEPARNIP
jgi:hypothetical protein